MIEQVFNVCIALVFLLIGFYLGHITNQQTNKPINHQDIKLKKDVLIKTAVKPGILEYPSQEQVDYVESGEEKVDQARTELFEKVFKP